MSDKDSVEEAAVKGLSSKNDKKSAKDNAKTKTDTAKAKAKKEKTGKSETRKVKTGKKSKIPEKGSAESEIHKQAAKAASVRLSEPEPALPEKGGAEAAAHNLASKAAAGEKGPEKQGAGFGFLALALLVPIAVVGGLYIFTTSLPERPEISQKSAETDKSGKENNPASAVKTAPKPASPTPANKADKKAAATKKLAASSAKETSASKPLTALKSTSKAATKTGKPHWDYKTTDWAGIAPSFATCGSGSSQSPINIITNTPNTGPVFRYNYFPSGGKVTNNGHSIQVDLAKSAQVTSNQLLVNGKAYDLIQFHFHTPSENAINGRQAPMEAHLVHKNAQGQLAVVAVMITVGVANQLIDRMPIPANKGDSNKSEGPHINPAHLLPNNRRVYTFTGSLTTPPCTQNVGWVVMQTPITISPATLAKYQKVMGKNNRPIQRTNARAIYSSN